MDQDLKAYLDEKFRGVDEKFAQVDRLSEQVDQLKRQFDHLSGQFDHLKLQSDQLKVYLSEKFEAIDEKFRQVDQRFVATEARLVHLISENSQSLQREIAAGVNFMTDMQRRLDRQGALIQTGARFSARISGWSERVDIALEDLKTRIQLLESKKPQPPQ